MKKTVMTAIMASIAVAPTMAAAMETTTSTAIGQDIQTFEASFFTQYTPQTALDMVNRLPGFILDGGTEARGFGETAGNVLIDGARPTNKTGGLQEVLTRIPAAQVARIEVRIGANSAGETAGQTMVANIIRKKDEKAGTWTASLHMMDGGPIRPSLDASFSTKLMGWDATIKLDTNFSDYNRKATIITKDVLGNTTSTAEENFKNGPRDASLSFDAARAAFGGKLQLNGLISIEDWFWDNDRRTHSLTTNVMGRDTIEGGWRNYSGELGMDWSGTLADDWKLRLLGLYSMNDERAEDNTTSESDDGSVSEAGLFVNNWRFSETILRTTIGKTSGRLKPEFGVEGAINTMDNEFFMAFADSADAVLNAEPVSDVKVKERRAEAFANVIYDITEKLTLNGGLRFEASRISAESTADSARSFTYFKPSLGLTFTPQKGFQLGLKYRRTVGQLSFADFAASNDALDDRVFEGNTELRPDRADRLEATLDYRLGARGALSLVLFHEWQQDVLAQAILPGGGIGLANTGKARQWGATAKATVGLDQIIKGGLLDLRLYLKDSRYTDPITDLVRNLGDEYPLVWSASFRHDIPGTQWAYGATYNSAEDRDLYYPADESHYDYRPRLNAFLETTQFLGVKTRLSVDNIFGDKFIRSRDFYEDIRTGAFTGSEVKAFNRNATIMLTVSGKF